MVKSFIFSFTAIFVALDIFGTLPMYISMTSEMKPGARDRIANLSMLVALVVAVAFVFLGHAIFRFLGIEIYDFKIAGGLVLLLVSLTDLAGKSEATQRTSGSTGVVPLAVPLITGPGVLTQVILQVGTFGYGITVAALVANYTLAWIFLRKSQVITRMIGKDGTIVSSKIAALLLAAISVAMIRSGVFEAISRFRMH